MRVLAILALLRLPAAAQAALLEDETGRRLLEDVYPASFFWPARDIVDARRLTTLTDVELETLCELQEVWTPEEHGRNPPDEEFARRFQDSLVLLPLPLPCGRRWTERRSIARLAVLNASVLCYSDSFSPASMSYYHDMDKYESVRFLEPLQWLGTNSEEAADELRAELLGGAKLSITAHVDPNPWKVVFEEPSRRAAMDIISVLLSCNVVLAITVLVKRRMQRRNKTMLPSVVLVTNVFINMYLSAVMTGWNGGRLKATMSLWLTHVSASGFSGITAGNDFLLAIFWKRIVESSFGAGSARLHLSDKIIVMAALNCYGGDAFISLLFLLHVPERAVYGIGGASLLVLQGVALTEINQSVYCVIKALQSAVGSKDARRDESAASTSERVLLHRIAFLIKVATVASILNLLPPIIYMVSPIYHADSPATMISVDILGLLCKFVNHGAQILIFWPIPRAKAGKSKVASAPTAAAAATSCSAASSGLS